MQYEQSKLRPVPAPVVPEWQSFFRQAYTAVAATGVLTVLCCGVYPAIVWGIAQTAFPYQANGSLVTRSGAPTTDANAAVGSRWLGQKFTRDAYFHCRPSAAGGGYDATASGGTNLGPLSDKYLNGVHGSTNADGSPNSAADFDGVKDLAVAYRKYNGTGDNAVVPADAVTRSASGLDPHISVANARLQAARVAKARGIDDAAVQSLISQSVDRPGFGVLGDAGVNVLTLNIALDAAKK